MSKKARPEMYWIESRKCWRKKKTLNGVKHTIEGKTQDEIRSKLSELKRLHESGIVFDDHTTLQQFAREWFPVRTAGLKPKSISVYNNAINVHIAPFFKDMKLKDIKPLHVKKMMSEKADRSKSLQSKILRTLNLILSEALHNGLITKNPCENIKASGYDYQKKTPLTKDQQYILIEAVKGKRCELFTLLCLYAGLRREEALGLMWNNVHLTNTPYIDVRHTVTFDKNLVIHSSDLKSNAAYRSIPIPVILSDLLAEKKKKAESVMVVPSVNTGGAMTLNAFKRMWEAIPGYKYNVAKRDNTGNVVKLDGKTVKTKIHRAGLVDFYVTPHLLRHTYLTELCASGLDIKKIQYLAGHESAQLTLKVYLHVTQNKPEELSSEIVKIFSA